jgi:AraC family transcriptional regulator, transcriptional activator of pobA
MKKNIEKHEFKEGLPHEFEIVDIGQLYNDLTTSFRTGFYHIIWFQKGSPAFLVDFNPVKIKPNTVLFLPKNTVQRFGKNSTFKGKAILFTESFFCKTENDTKFLRTSTLFSDLLSVTQIQLQSKDSIFSDLFQLMETELANEIDISQADILRNLLHNFLLLSERKRRKQNFTKIKKGANHDNVLLFKDLLEANYRKLKQVNNYTEKLNITEKQLNRATSKIIGKSPKQMINERVMLESKRLLAHSNKSIKEISFELGFDEPTNFTKYFLKHAKTTPVRFREKFNLS